MINSYLNPSKKKKSKVGSIFSLFRLIIFTLVLLCLLCPLSDFLYKCKADNNIVPVYELGGLNNPFYTISFGERETLINSGWEDDGIAWYTNNNPNFHPIYRLCMSGTSQHYYTENIVERDVHVRSGWIYEGIAWYYDSDSAATDIYKLSKPGTNAQLYTISLSKRDLLISEGWTCGTSGTYGDWSGYATASVPIATDNIVPVYELGGLNNPFYTISFGERERLINSGWEDNGIAWYTNNNEDLAPVYRLLYSSSNHFYTASSFERDRALANLSWGFSSEGVGWFTDNSNGVPIYRLYSSNSNVHIYTLSPSRRDSLVNSGWSYEGVAWLGLLTNLYPPTISSVNPSTGNTRGGQRCSYNR